MVSCRSVIVAIHLLLGTAAGAQSQSNRYMVFFTDKQSTPFSIERPEEFLSERALGRREKQGVAITEEDLPVDPAYVEALDQITHVFFTTKWFNGALVQATSADIQDIEGLDFVSSVELVAPDEVLTTTRGDMPSPGPWEAADTTGWSTEFQNNLLGGDLMHEEDFRGEGLLIAVLDGGFRGVHQQQVFRHLFDEDRVAAVRDFVTDSYDPFQFSRHGTAVLSCIAGYRSEKIKGLAPNSQVALFVTEEVATEYRVEEYNWVFAAEMADSLGADIINTSLGYSTDFDLSSMDYPYSAMDGETTVITRAAEMAFSKGIFLVTSNGNDGNSSWQFLSAPADAPNILAVGSVDVSLSKSSFSSIGPSADDRIKPDVSALGRGVTVFWSSFTSGDGTSYAAPLVTGLAAGIWQKNPEWTNAQLLHALRSSGSSSQSPNNQIGYGVPNFRPEEPGAILSVDDPGGDVIVYPNPVIGSQLTLDFTKADFQLISGQLVSTGGEILYAFSGENRSRRFQLDLSGLSSGLYYLKLVGRNESQTLKVLKR